MKRYSTCSSGVGGENGPRLMLASISGAKSLCVCVTMQDIIPNSCSSVSANKSLACSFHHALLVRHFLCDKLCRFVFKREREASGWESTLAKFRREGSGWVGQNERSFGMHDQAREQKKPLGNILWYRCAKLSLVWISLLLLRGSGCAVLLGLTVMQIEQFVLYKPIQFPESPHRTAPE